MSTQIPEPRFSKASFTFLEDLEVHNNRQWFSKHRSIYEESLRLPFADTLEEASRMLARTKNPLLGGEHTMFRIQRDVRFSPDKTPYSTHVSGVLTKTGRKDVDGTLVYVHLNASGGFIAAGLHQARATRLEPVRRSMLDDERAFARVLNQLDKADLKLDDSEATKAMPRGFADAVDHRFAEYVRLKNLIVTVPLRPSEWISGRPAQRIADFAKASAPLLSFIDAHE